jgi:hypothetical protein
MNLTSRSEIPTGTPQLSSKINHSMPPALQSSSGRHRLADADWSLDFVVNNGEPPSMFLPENQRQNHAG